MPRLNDPGWPVAARWLTVLLVVLAAGCDAHPSPAPISGTATLSPEPRVGATRLLAELSGQLRVVDGCVRVESNLTPESLLLVWPVDITATVYLQTVVVTDEISRQQSTWQTGEIVTLGGGNIPSVGADLRRVGSASCPGPYWLVGSVGAAATPTPGASSTAAATLVPAATASALSAAVTAPETVNARRGPSTVYDIVGALQPGQAYAVVGQAGQWWAVALPTGQTAWVVKALVVFSGDATVVPVREPPPLPTVLATQTTSAPLSPLLTATPTLPSSVSELAQDGIVTFTSTAFGLTFSYRSSQLGTTVSTLVRSDRVYVYYTDSAPDGGQYVQVFHKAPGESLQQAIRQQILHGYQPDDCQIVIHSDSTYEGLTVPPDYVLASVQLPRPPSTTPDPAADLLATEVVQAQRCPQPYTEFGGQAYFMMDPRHSERFFFFKIGQYWIYSAGPAEYGDPWQSTLRVLDVSS